MKYLNKFEASLNELKSAFNNSPNRFSHNKPFNNRSGQTNNHTNNNGVQRNYQQHFKPRNPENNKRVCFNCNRTGHTYMYCRAASEAQKNQISQRLNSNRDSPRSDERTIARSCDPTFDPIISDQILTKTTTQNQVFTDHFNQLIDLLRQDRRLRN